MIIRRPKRSHFHWNPPSWGEKISALGTHTISWIFLGNPQKTRSFSVTWDFSDTEWNKKMSCRTSPISLEELLVAKVSKRKAKKMWIRKANIEHVCLPSCCCLLSAPLVHYLVFYWNEHLRSVAELIKILVWVSFIVLAGISEFWPLSSVGSPLERVL